MDAMLLTDSTHPQDAAFLGKLAKRVKKGVKGVAKGVSKVARVASPLLNAASSVANVVPGGQLIGRGLGVAGQVAGGANVLRSVGGAIPGGNTALALVNRGRNAYGLAKPFLGRSGDALAQLAPRSPRVPGIRIPGRRPPKIRRFSDARGLEGARWRVDSGDSPSSIAKKVVGDANRWRELRDANPQKKVNPATGNFVTLNPGEYLTLPLSWVAGAALPATPPAPPAPPGVTPVSITVPGLPPNLTPPGVSVTPGTSGGTYLVQSGDSPSSISKKITGDAGRWRELRDANVPPKKVDPATGNFTSLNPGEVLRLPASWVSPAPGPSVTIQPPIPGAPPVTISAPPQPEVTSPPKAAPPQPGGGTQITVPGLGTGTIPVVYTPPQPGGGGGGGSTTTIPTPMGDITVKPPQPGGGGGSVVLPTPGPSMGTMLLIGGAVLVGVLALK